MINFSRNTTAAQLARFHPTLYFTAVLRNWAICILVLHNRRKIIMPAEYIFIRFRCKYYSSAAS